jgi:hypothetical protein
MSIQQIANAMRAGIPKEGTTTIISSRLLREPWYKVWEALKYLESQKWAELRGSRWYITSRPQKGEKNVRTKKK